MSYKITTIEGIGETYGARLNAQQIFNTDDLLTICGTKKGRETVAAATSIPESLVLTWVNHADLMRIKGIAGQFSELLEAAGVDTVKEFAQRNAENLHAKMLETNEKLGLSGSIPSITSLQAMIDEAKTLEQKVFH
jgi:predicted flap endonuclease-1-like 5' DNA nuclease